MHELLFLISIVLLALIFIKRKNISEFFLYTLNIGLSTKIINIILVLCFTLVLIVGMLFDDTKDKFSKISQNYDNLTPNESKRPHRYFDVNTYD